MGTKENEINKKLLKTAINLTSEHRESLDLIHNWEHILDLLKNDEDMKKRWKVYQKTYYYARDIEYDDLMKSVEKVGKIYNKYNKAGAEEKPATIY